MQFTACRVESDAETRTVFRFSIRYFHSYPWQMKPSQIVAQGHYDICNCGCLLVLLCCHEFALEWARQEAVSRRVVTEVGNCDIRGDPGCLQSPVEG